MAKVVRLLNVTSGLAYGPAVTTAKAGTLVAVEVQVTTPDDVKDVLLVDPLAGCLEAEDGGGGRSSSSLGGGDWGWWWYQAFPSRQVRKNEVSAYSPLLTAGTHSFLYTALVVTPGTFVLPPAKVSAALQPELMGLSGGGTFTATQAGLSLPAADAVAVRDASVPCNEPAPVPKLGLVSADTPNPSPRSPGSSDGDGDGGLSAGAVVAIVVVVIAALAAAAAALIARSKQHGVATYAPMAAETGSVSDHAGAARHSGHRRRSSATTSSSSGHGRRAVRMA